MENQLISNNNFGKMLEKQIKKKFNSQSVFANKIGVTQATVSRYITGNAQPSFKILRKISDVLQIDLGLITQTNDEYSDNINHVLKIPFYYSEISAGKGLESFDNNYQNLYFDESFLKNQFLINNVKDIFAVKVKGDSMEPIISEGDIVFAKKFFGDPSSQEVYIICYNDEYFIKKIQIKSRRFINMISTNPEYDRIEIDLQDETTNFSILAKVLGRINIKNFTNYSSSI